MMAAQERYCTPLGGPGGWLVPDLSVAPCGGYASLVGSGNHGLAPEAITNRRLRRLEAISERGATEAGEARLRRLGGRR